MFNHHKLAAVEWIFELFNWDRFMLRRNQFVGLCLRVAAGKQNVGLVFISRVIV
jgi:hypothetical protein